MAFDGLSSPRRKPKKVDIQKPKLKETDLTEIICKKLNIALKRDYKNEKINFEKMIQIGLIFSFSKEMETQGPILV